MLPDGLVRQGFCRTGVQLIGQFLESMPGHGERRRNDQHNGRTEKQLAFGGEGDLKPAQPIEHPTRILPQLRGIDRCGRFDVVCLSQPML